MDPTQTTLIELRDAIASGGLKAEDATRAYLDRIERHNAALGAFAEVYADRALQRAQQVDAGQLTGPLAGVPIAIKDILCTEYGHTTCSSKMLEGYRSPFTATAVQRLEDAGAVILGKTRMDEFAMGSSCETCCDGPVHNPWDTARVPGGSSGGSAAAMAADLCAASLGSDTGGSIRQPAALCGVVGMKPTYGRISRWGLIAFASSLDQIGPFTRTVADTALLLSVMMGHDPHDSTCVDVHVPQDLDDVEAPANGDETPLRIGIAKQYMLEGANDPAVTRATEDAIAIYRDAGAQIVEVDLPHTDYGIPVYYIVAPAEASSNLARYDGIHFGHRAKDAENLIDLYAASRSEGFGDEVKRRIMLGTYALSSGYYDAYYNKALKVRRLIKNDFDAAFEQCDAILCPTTTGPAFRLGEKTDDPLSMYLNDIYTVNANLAGIPGISLPGGFAEAPGGDGKSLPVGVQLIGRAFDELRLLRIARVYERATDHWRQRPAL
ncbi:MAG: Asp-tRNA(Asn)/Glu-tRNA(Gln) amidotransferase subunit GatA [Planctomycetes bacterium]|jgi:aspartyl-tRNA(Asn)/glutamyl-tRNA(Gln) amidotransferase subunit A|nr:Asp-tRNA(Asn)/Glu-tRNA(Gln) amidotransferase subunit GatA [Planctomycetota bacterium]